MDFPKKEGFLLHIYLHIYACKNISDIICLQYMLYIEKYAECTHVCIFRYVLNIHSYMYKFNKHIWQIYIYTYIHMCLHSIYIYIKK